ncbi:MAG: hypothetical protein AB7T63_14935 [Planctomycetota bacterium]
MRTRRWLWLAFAGFVLAFGYFIWPTPWVYETKVCNGNLVALRRHRLTGDIEGRRLYLRFPHTRGWAVFEEKD